jgi:hypothetical protein
LGASVTQKLQQAGVQNLDDFHVLTTEDLRSAGFSIVESRKLKTDPAQLLSVSFRDDMIGGGRMYFCLFHHCSTLFIDELHFSLYFASSSVVAA